MNEQKNGFSIPRSYAPATVKFLKHLPTIAILETVTWEQLSEVCGGNCRPQTKFYSNLCTARKSLESNERIVFHTIPMIGIQRMDDSGSSIVSIHRRATARRMTRKAKRAAMAVNVANLPDDERSVHLANVAQLSAMELFSDHNANKRLTGKIDSVEMAIGVDPAKLLEVFRSKS